MPWWLTALIWSAVFVVSEIIRPKPRIENARPAGLGDFSFPTATEGRAVPIIWGTVRIKAPNVVWYGDLTVQRITQEVSTGLFSSDEITTGYRYYVGLMFALCRGPVDELRAIYIGDKFADGGRIGAGPLSIDQASLFGGTARGSGGIVGDCEFYVGDGSQTADPYLTTQLGETPPGFRGTCYLVFEGGYVGTSPNIQPWSFDVRRIPDGLNLAVEQPGDESVNGGDDANPMNVIYEILTDTDWGLKIPTGSIDIVNFRAAAATLAAENNGWSFILDNELKASELLLEVQRQIDGSLYFDRSDGLWKMTLIRDDYTVGDLDLFNEDNVAEVADYSRTTWWETINQVRLLFTDIDDEFKQTYAFAQDMANVEIQGGNVSTDVRYPGVKHRTLANILAWRELSTLAYPLAKVTLVVNRDAFTLRPGSAFRWSNTKLGIEDLVLRVNRINYGRLDDNLVRVSCVQDIFTTPGAGTFGDPTSTGWDGAEEAPVAPTSADTLIFEAPRQLVIKDSYAPTQQPRTWIGARDPGGGTNGFEAWSRYATTRPLAGTFEGDTDIRTFLIAGKLETDIVAYGSSAARPDTSYSISVLEDPDSLSGVAAGNDFVLPFSSGDGGVRSLRNICYVDGEFIGFEGVTDGSGKITLTSLHRGLFHTAPKAHAANTRVWFIGNSGGNLSRASYGETNDEIDYKLRSTSITAILDLVDVPTEEVTLNSDRIWPVPLAPRDPELNDTYADDTDVTVDGSYVSGTGLTGEDARALKASVSARAWRVDDVLDDRFLSNSNPAWIEDSPNFDFKVTLDPTGTPVDTAAFNDAPISSSNEPTAYITRNSMIVALGANREFPTTGRLVVTAKHTPAEVGVEVTNPVDMEFDFTIVSGLQSADDLTFGGLDVNTPSAIVVFGETGSYAFDIYTALPSSGILEGRINGGSWTTIVGAGSSTGSLAVTAADEVELRFTQSPPNDQFFDITGPTAELGYGVLKA